MSNTTEIKKSIQAADAAWRAKAREHLGRLAMPHWALGRVMDLAVDLAGITRSLSPSFARRKVVVMAGDHGIAAEGVSAYPAEVTRHIVRTMARGGAGINVIARQARAEVVIVDMGVAVDLGTMPDTEVVLQRKVALGTRNFAVEPAMSRAEALRSVEIGMELAWQLGPGTDIFCAGEMGIANSTAATAILCALTGVDANFVTGRGTGLDDKGLEHKVRVIREALALHQPDRGDGLDVLAKVGGFEIGGLAGLMLGAAAQGKPVVIDGFISTSAALVAQSLEPLVADYLIASHQSVERGHRDMLKHLGKTAHLDLGLRLGEGTGAALMLHLVDAATGLLGEMFTLEQALSD